MVKLNKALLKRGLAAILTHGYSDFFPVPPELEIVRKNWNELSSELAEIDLDTYDGYSQVSCFAPKLSKLNVRKVGRLHPFDLIFYTSIVSGLRQGISAARLPADKVFSYRLEGAARNRLYAETPAWSDFREAVKARVSSNPDTIVGITDIADFYPRVYQHRVVNALEASSEPSERPYIRALVSRVIEFLHKSAAMSFHRGGGESRDVGQDRVCRLRPNKGFGMFVTGIEKFPNGSFQLPHTGMGAAPNLPLGEQAKPALNQVEPGRVGGREVQVIAGAAGEPAADGWSLVGRVVVQHQVHLAFCGKLASR